MVRQESIDQSKLIDALLACPEDGVEAWICSHISELSMDTLAALKLFANNPRVTADPVTANQATQRALLVAKHLVSEPLAYPLACWARSNWAMYHVPAEAIDYCRIAIQGYQEAEQPFQVACIQVTLLAALIECGHNREADECYHETVALFQAFPETEPHHLLILNQNYGWLLYSQGRYNEACALYRESIPYAQSNGHGTTAIEMEANLAESLVMLGELREAQTLLYKALPRAQHHEQTLTVARILMNLGKLNTVLGHPSRALEHFAHARPLFEQIENQMEVATVSMYEGTLLDRIGAHREALRRYDHARRLFIEREMWPQVGQATLNLSRVYRFLGEYDLAERLLAESSSIWQKLEQKIWLAHTQLEAIKLAIAQDDIGKASALLDNNFPELDNAMVVTQYRLLLADVWRLSGNPDLFEDTKEIYEELIQLASERGDQWLLRDSMRGLGRLYSTQDRQKTFNYLEKSVELSEEIRRMLTVEELKAGYQESTDSGLDDLIMMSLATADSNTTLTNLWRKKAGGFLETFTALSTEDKLSHSERNLLSDIREKIAVQRWNLMTESVENAPDQLIESKDEQLLKLEQKLLDLRRRRNHPWDNDQGGNRRTSNDQVCIVPRPSSGPHLPSLDFDEQRPDKTFRGEYPNDQSSQYSVSDILSTMEADLLLEYDCVQGEIVGVSVDRAGNYHALSLCKQEESQDLLADLQLLFENVVTQSVDNLIAHGATWRAECLPLLPKCFDLLVSPFLPQSIKNGEEVPKLLIAPCDPLYLLPFAAFWDSQRYLMECFEIETILSGGLLERPDQATPAIGVPLLIASSADGTLQVTKDEVHAAADCLPHSKTLIDVPRSVSYLQELTEPPRLLHLAAHSVLRHDAPLFSGLQLAGEVLSVEQCYDLPLQGTELVTLSGCSTVAGMDSGGALLAFQTALMMAGAQRIVSSLWSIPDTRSTTDWMRHFYSAIAQGFSVPRSVRHTQLQSLSDPSCNHPAIWAAFVCSRR
ncbi:CHAT domain-containing protein [Chloroflexi bacterium TSY]|nr:CHAT domain-containing protein [Chloroflexi bacterium TSY]